MISRIGFFSIASALALAVASNASAVPVPVEGTLTALVFADIVDVGTVGDDTGEVIGGFGAIVPSLPAPTGVFSGISGVTLFSFTYTEGSTFDPAQQIVLAGGDLAVDAVKIDVVNETFVPDAVNPSIGFEQAELFGSGLLRSATSAFDPTPIYWGLNVNTQADTFGTFSLSTETPLGGGGAGGPTIPEPTAVLAFGLGLAVVGGSLIKRRR